MHRTNSPKNPNAQTRDGAHGLLNFPPYRILQEAIRAVPAVKYALGVTGIVAAIAIVKSFGIDLRLAVFGTIVTFVLMVVLVIFAKFSTMAPHHFLRPILVLVWSFLTLTIAAASLLFTSVFFKHPVDLQAWLKPSSAQTVPDRVAALPAGNILVVAYTGEPPSPPAHVAKPELQFEIVAKRSGEVSFGVIANGDSLASVIDDYCVLARGLSEGYLYIFQVDSSGKAEWLFPQNNQSKFSVGSNPLMARQTIQIPAADQDRLFYLDKATGIEHVYAVFSATRWTALEDALANPAPSTSATRSALSDTSIQEPNGLGLRSIGGTSEYKQKIDLSNLLPLEGVEEGKKFTLPFSSKPLEATGFFLVEERWFKHVHP
jgi:hypothetical protein